MNVNNPTYKRSFGAAMATDGRSAALLRAQTLACGLMLLAAFWSSIVEAEEYLSTEEFLQQAFDGAAAKAETLWLQKKQKTIAKDIFQHPYRGMRVRYWHSGVTTAWIMEEIGKERPIRIGVIIDDQQIRDVKVLAFRESRGWEVRYPFFTDQFKGAGLKSNQKLDRSIDGITGATLSVWAVTRVARFALYLANESAPKRAHQVAQAGSADARQTNHKTTTN